VKRGTREVAAEWVPIADLKAWADNPRKNDAAVPKVVESIKRFGFAAPIVARKADGEIIAGHTRIRAAEALGLDKVPVRFMDLDPADAHLLALADNRLNEKADWDDAVLLKLLDDVGSADAELAGWDKSDLDKMADSLLPDTDGQREAGDDSSRLDGSFAVVVECASEEEQLHIISECEERGWSCRALT